MERNSTFLPLKVLLLLSYLPTLDKKLAHDFKSPFLDRNNYFKSSSALWRLIE